MANELTVSSSELATQKSSNKGSLVLGAGLAVASMILVPAVAMRLGLGASLTGALRIALMKASSRATHGGSDDSGAASAGFSCH
ncbi:MAG: hypothetical protein L3J75_13340 [Methylococcaceae bacterium]|nr:hypothetical protein [Methylococcaceae bacterium]